MITKGIISDDDIAKIRAYSRVELEPEEVYIFNVTLCNNDIDRDYERFSKTALEQLAPLFVGKTGIFDHSMKACDQKARIFETFVQRVDGKKTADGEELYELRAKAYMLNNDENKTLIDEINGGIKKEVSVSCSCGASICSVCGKNNREEFCEHIKGRKYNDVLCFKTLEQAQDAYEFSFVAVPAQRGAEITKSFENKEDVSMQEIIEKMAKVDSDLTISKNQAMEICSYIDSLKSEASLGEEYKKELQAEIVGMFKKAFPQTDETIFSSVVSVMTVKELMGFKDGIAKQKAKQSQRPQLVSNTGREQKNYSEFKI